MNSARDVQPIWVAEVLSRIRHRKASAASLELNWAGPTPLSPIAHERYRGGRVCGPSYRYGRAGCGPATRSQGPATSLGKPGRNAPNLVICLDPTALTQ